MINQPYVAFIRSSFSQVHQYTNIIYCTITIICVVYKTVENEVTQVRDTFYFIDEEFIVPVAFEMHGSYGTT